VASRGDALGQTRPSGVVSDFAEKLGAELIDGAEAFRGLTQEQLAGLWFPTDGHWNQRGSDAFARMMWDRIRPRQAPSKDSETRPPPPTS
jgi:hypothetical protein